MMMDRRSVIKLICATPLLVNSGLLRALFREVSQLLSPGALGTGGFLELPSADHENLTVMITLTPPSKSSLMVTPLSSDVDMALEVFQLDELIGESSLVPILARANILVLAAENLQDALNTARALAEIALNASLKVLVIPGGKAVLDGLTVFYCPCASSGAEALDLALVVTAGFLWPALNSWGVSHTKKIIEQMGPSVLVCGRRKAPHEEWPQFMQEFLASWELSHLKGASSCALILLAGDSLRICDLWDCFDLLAPATADESMLLCNVLISPFHQGIVAILPGAP